MTANPNQDQMDAATEEAHGMWKATGEMMETVQRECTGDSVGGRIAQRFLNSLDTPEARMCPHVTGPQPIVGSACVPGVVGCPLCIQLLVKAKRALDRSTGGRICDSCGDRTNEYHPALMQRGPLLLDISVCRFCMAMSELDEADAEPTPD
jgi:hypothetical protein